LESELSGNPPLLDLVVETTPSGNEGAQEEAATAASLLNRHQLKILARQELLFEKAVEAIEVLSAKQVQLEGQCASSAWWWWAEILALVVILVKVFVLSS
jgi:hypothetical protein